MLTYSEGRYMPVYQVNIFQKKIISFSCKEEKSHLHILISSGFGSLIVKNFHLTYDQFSLIILANIFWPESVGQTWHTDLKESYNSQTL